MSYQFCYKLCVFNISESNAQNNQYFSYVTKPTIPCLLFISYAIYAIFFTTGRPGFPPIGGNFGGKFDYFY